jgi:peptide/nickel transport system substrate-binding protein
MQMKPRPQYLMLLLSLATALVMILSSCGTQPASSPPPSNSTGKVTPGGTFVDDIFEDASSLMPNGSAETYADLLDNAIYTPLFNTDANGKMVPALAKEIPTLANGEISAAFMTWTIKLRTDVKWSDGQPVNADDVDYTWKLWNNIWDGKKYGAASTTGYNLITSADVAPDKASITFHLKQAYAPFLTLWVDGINAPMPKHHFASMPSDTILKSAENLHPTITDGAFTISESVHGDHYTFVKDPNFYRHSEGLPYLDKIVFRVVPNQDTILKDFQAGSIDASWFLDVSKKDIYSSMSGYHTVVNPVNANFEVMVMNFNNAILGKAPEVRKAISMAIDHDALIKTARHGLASSLCIPETKAYNPGYQADAPCPKFDPAAANQLLDQAGWTKGADGVRAKNGQRLEFKYSTTANNKWRATDEQIIQSNLSDIGIKLNIENHPADEYFGPFLNGGKHDLAEFETGDGIYPDNAPLIASDQVPPNGENWSFYSNKQLDDLLHQVQKGGDPAALQQAFNQIHQIYLTDFPFIILYGVSDLAVAKNTVQGYAPGPYAASESVGIWNWNCVNGKC